MPDISMCEGKECPLKENCYRYKATPSEYWQSYFTEEPFYKDGDIIMCDHFLEIYNKKPKK